MTTASFRVQKLSLVHRQLLHLPCNEVAVYLRGGEKARSKASCHPPNMLLTLIIINESIVGDASA